MKKIISAIFVAAFAVLFVLFPCAEEIPVISEMPSSVTVSAGEEVLLSCGAEDPTDGAAVKYVWYRTPSPDDEGDAVTEAQIIGTYQPNTDFPGSFYYYCVVHYIYEETSTHAKSDVITVTVEGNVKIEKPVLLNDLETSYSVPQGGELVISVDCESQSEPVILTYQWYSKHPSEKVFNKVSGANENTLKVPSDSIGTRQYLCMATASYGEHSSNTQSTITRVEVYSHDHTFGEWSTVLLPTCMAEGEEQRTCECGATEKNVLDILEHSYGEWTVTREPTAYAEGERTRICSACGISEVMAISPLGTTEAETTSAPQESESDTESSTVPTDTTSEVETEKYQPQNGFPWWNAILIFGILSTVGSAAAAVYFIRRSDSIMKDERKKIVNLQEQTKIKEDHQNNEKTE